MAYSREAVQHLKETYPEGVNVVLYPDKGEDYDPKAEGTVVKVDYQGLHIAMKGSDKMAVCKPGVDRFQVVNDNEYQSFTSLTESEKK